MESGTETPVTSRLDLRETSNMSVASLALPKRQKVFEKTFLPAGDTLPVWALTPLDQKLPIVSSPRGTYTFYTNRVGESKYTSKQKYDFDLTNPQGREAPGSYDSLTDPSLKTYFASPRQKRHLIDNGLITHRGEIVCGLKDFNAYREFVRYRSVTELSLQKKKEKRVQVEHDNKVYLEWPNIHKKRRNHNKNHREPRETLSEPPRHSRNHNNNNSSSSNGRHTNHNNPQSAHHNGHLPGLEMYNENLSLNVHNRRKECQTRAKEWQRSPRRVVDREDGARGFHNDGNPEVRGTSPVRRRAEASPRSRMASATDTDVNHPNYVARANLVDDMRKRELQLNKRLEDMRKQRVLEHKRKVEESWRERQYRQEKLLQQEADLEAKAKDERSQHIITREKTLLQHREKQEAKLRRIRQDLSKSGSQYGSGGGNSVSPKESYVSVTPKDNYTSMTPKGHSVTPKGQAEEDEIEEEIVERLELDDDSYHGGGGGRTREEHL